MIKTLGCLLILAASTFGGFAYAENFKKRVRQLNELERAVNQLQNEIEYTYTPLPEALRNVSQKCDAPMSLIFKKASEFLYNNEVESVYEAFKKCIDLCETNISKEDMNILMDLSKSLGESDVEGHKKMFSLAKNNLKKRISLAEEAVNKNVKMYRYLGFSLGAMIVIVLI
ncbi:stage III sporulation protein SpoIIIAB [Clostridium swellfunianum]|uniref:stage III sporulation protein SpoIIIAB n=1 Tax=Clostridium swellfunianum TaxID=1367462 RepID=UPI00202E5992|nr:stage III sporulation protein SpoIIIAB [Clostridium swellfunianum]MCM0650378.1 stage III sporulation protein SpoIIIAB [Clostridium swellfunianum]